MTMSPQGPSTEARKSGVTRRGFAAMGAGAAAFAVGAKASTGTLEVTERVVGLPVGAGSLAAKIYEPNTGEHPGLIMWAPSGAGVRAAATRLSEQGWSVLVVNEEKDIDSPAFKRKARQLVAWLQQQPSVARLPGKVSGGATDLGNGYVLRSVGATAPRLSLASAGERRIAAQTAYLFAMPSTETVRSPERLATLNEAARKMLSSSRTSLAEA